MKRFLTLFAAAAMLFAAGCESAVDLSEVNDRLDSLEQRMSAAEALLKASENGIYIVSVQQTTDGYVFFMSDGSQVAVYNGKDGTDGKNGADGTNGSNGTAGDSLIKSIAVGDMEVTFTLTDGRTFSIPLYSALSITFDKADLELIPDYSERNVHYTIHSNLTDNITIEVVTSADILAEVVKESATTGYININTTTVTKYSRVLVFVSNGEKTILKNISLDGSTAVPDDDDNGGNGDNPGSGNGGGDSTDDEEAVLVITNGEVRTISDAGGELEIAVETNLDYTISIAADAQSWVSVKETRALRSETVVFEIAQNKGDGRSAIVDFLCNESIFTTIYIIQDDYTFYRSEKIAIISATDNQHHEGEGAENLIDGDFSTVYHSPWELPYDDPTTTFPVEWEFTFAQPSTVDYFILYSGTGNGRPGKFNVKYKNGGDWTMMTAVDGTVPTDEAPLFDFGQKGGTQYCYFPARLENLTDVRIIFYDGAGDNKSEAGGGYISSQEIEFYIKSDTPQIINETNIIRYTSSDGDEIQNQSYAPHTFGNVHLIAHTPGMLIFDNKPTEIGSYAFYGWTSLTNITIPESVTQIGSYAFSGCWNLEEFRGKLATDDGRCLIVDGVLKAFAPASLTEYSIPSGVTKIGDGAFSECTSLTSITIPESVTQIGASAFQDCTSLTSITIPESVTQIGVSAFQDCTSLTNITIPESVTQIGIYAFYGCWNIEFRGKLATDDGRCLIVDGVLKVFAPASLTEYSIPSGVTKIGDGAFQGCASLTSITIPESVTEIGDSVFLACRATNIYCQALTPPSWNPNPFNDDYPGRKFYVPYQSLDAYKTASGWSRYADDIVGYDF